MAKELDVPSKDLVEAFKAMGVEVKNHLAWVDEADAEVVKKKLTAPVEAPAPAPTPAPEPQQPAVAAGGATTSPRPMSPQAPAAREGMGAVGPRPGQPQNVSVPQRRPEGPPGPGRPGMPGGPRPGMPGGPGPRPGMGPRPDGGPRPGMPGARPGMGPGNAPPREGARPDRKPGSGRSDSHRKEGGKDDEKVFANKNKPRRKSKAEIREERRVRRAGGEPAEIPTSIDLVGPLTVKELADKMKAKETEIIKRLFLKGIMATINQTIEKETAEMIAVEMGYEVQLIDPIAQALAATSEEEEDASLLLPRSPIVTIMGHVDHGKTSLLDAIRSTRVASGEAGGITQHIGAYLAEVNGQEICFLDTPGHEAFTAMRARGAKATDVAVLVVAADDGVMPQTEEAISHAKAAGVPIVVAINKIDKPGADPNRVKQELTAFDLVSEEWGGTTIMVEVSAKARINLDTLLEMILLQAEVLELRANPDKPAKGVIIEAKLSKSMGPVATVLVQSGTLRVGDPFVVGSISGKVRALINDLGKRVKEAGPSHPVEVLGMPEVPHAGDVFQAVESEKVARTIAEARAIEERSQRLSRQHVTLKNFYSRMQEGQKELPIIIKSDVKGSSEAIEQNLSQLNERTAGTTIRIIHSGNGDISEADINLAAASDALVIGFNVKADDRAVRAAEEEKVDIRLYNIIYKMAEDLEKAMLGLLEPEFETILLGKAEVRAIFKSGKAGVIAGCMVTEGKIKRDADAKVYRNGKLVHEGKLDSLKRFKDDAKEVATGYECGISFEKYNDLEENDVIEAWVTQEKER
jgi:translation initiation factor IF-2